jgi:hypothetical protein
MVVADVLAVHLVASLHLLQDDLYNCSRFACNTQSGSWRNLQPLQDFYVQQLPCQRTSCEQSSVQLAWVTPDSMQNIRTSLGNSLYIDFWLEDADQWPL